MRYPVLLRLFLMLSFAFIAFGSQAQERYCGESDCLTEPCLAYWIQDDRYVLLDIQSSEGDVQYHLFEIGEATRPLSESEAAAVLQPPHDRLTYDRSDQWPVSVKIGTGAPVTVRDVQAPDPADPDHQLALSDVEGMDDDWVVDEARLSADGRYAALSIETNPDTETISNTETGAIYRVAETSTFVWDVTGQKVLPIDSRVIDYSLEFDGLRFTFAAHDGVTLLALWDRESIRLWDSGRPDESAFDALPVLVNLSGDERIAVQATDDTLNVIYPDRNAYYSLAALTESLPSIPEPERVEMIAATPLHDAIGELETALNINYAPHPTVYDQLSVAVADNYAEPRSTLLLDAESGEVLFGFAVNTVLRTVDGALEQSVVETPIRSLELIDGERPVYVYTTDAGTIHVVDLATQEELAVLDARRLFFNAAGTQAVYFEGDRAKLFNAVTGESSELMALAGGLDCLMD